MSTPDPEPTALDKALLCHAEGCRISLRFSAAPGCTCGIIAARFELASLRSDLAAVQAERDALVEKLAKIEENVERNSVGILRALYGDRVQVRKLEVNSQPEKVPPTG